MSLLPSPPNWISLWVSSEKDGGRTVRWTRGHSSKKFLSFGWISLTFECVYSITSNNRHVVGKVTLVSKDRCLSQVSVKCEMWKREKKTLIGSLFSPPDPISTSNQIPFFFKFETDLSLTLSAGSPFFSSLLSLTSVHSSKTFPNFLFSFWTFLLKIQSPIQTHVKMQKLLKSMWTPLSWKSMGKEAKMEAKC